MQQQKPMHGSPTEPSAPPAPDTDLKTGLTSQEVQAALEKYGRNTIKEKKTHPILKLLSYFWGPIPWMIETAAALSAVVRHWPDFFIILALLIFNAGIGFWQEFKAANALNALKKGLALKARVLRDGKWDEIDAIELVPGDIIRLRLGDVAPADAHLAYGEFISVDQAALTGESLPVSKKTGEEIYSGSIIKQGEMAAVVTATGAQTFFGRTAKLVETAGAGSHFQKAVMRIGNFLIVSSLILSVILVAVELYRNQPIIETLQFVLVLTIASIPVAMPAVLSVTMALGALALSKEKAIVSRLQSIEEMAGIDILCTDKTGTLTQNKLMLGDPALFSAKDSQSLVLMASLASKIEDGDAIDLAIISGLKDRAVLNDYAQTEFVPFDPVSKRTEAAIIEHAGPHYRVTKGAPQVVIALTDIQGDELKRANSLVTAFAAKGYRTIGVARSDDDGANWSLQGLLPLFDPPCDDSAATIAHAEAQGVEIKMVTGDDVAIAREIAGTLGIGQHIEPATDLFGEDGQQVPPNIAERIEQTDGFARVFPEHKYNIVKALQQRGHIVGMTGDGVNDAPAIKQADVGIAVSGATDAARAAADLILTRPGLSTIVRAIDEARRIFERMNSYAIYRINETIRAMIFIVLALIIYGFYPITAIMIILLAFLNDLPIMLIAYDNTKAEPKPVRWDMKQVLTVASTMGLTGTIGSFGMLTLAKDVLHLTIPEIQTYVFLKLMVSGHVALLIARARSWFFLPPWPSLILLGMILTTDAIATLMAVHPMGLMAPIAWVDIGIIWAYAISFAFITDIAKMIAYRITRTGPHKVNDTREHKLIPAPNTTMTSAMGGPDATNAN